MKYFGAINSLTQTLLKLTSPGVPDIYQGAGTVGLQPGRSRQSPAGGFQLRRGGCWTSLREQRDRRQRDSVSELLRNYQDGRIKLWVTMQAAELPARAPRIVQPGKLYSAAGRTAAKKSMSSPSRRSYGGESVIVAAPRFAYTPDEGQEEPPIGAAWSDAELALPPQAARRIGLRNFFTGEERAGGHGTSLLCRESVRTSSVALLTAEAGCSASPLRSAFARTASRSVTSPGAPASLPARAVSAPLAQPPRPIADASCWEHSCAPRCRAPAHPAREQSHKLATEVSAARMNAHATSSSRVMFEVGRRRDSLFFGRGVLPPAHGGVVVVGAGVDHGIGLVRCGR